MKIITNRRIIDNTSNFYVQSNFDDYLLNFDEAYLLALIGTRERKILEEFVSNFVAETSNFNVLGLEFDE